jgi:shikimate kinase
MSHPVLYVLAGVNGAGKSSVGGHLLTRAGLPWFNPDSFARELRAATGCDPTAANAAAWTEGMRRLDAAVQARQSFAFETTLGGRSVPARLRAASRTHEVLVWFCGLASPELHLARVRSACRRRPRHPPSQDPRALARRHRQPDRPAAAPGRGAPVRQQRQRGAGPARARPTARGRHSKGPAGVAGGP